MQISLSMWSLYRLWRDEELTIPGFIDLAAAWGFPGVELLDFFYKDAPRERIEAKAALDSNGIQCPIFSVSQNFAKPTASQRKTELDKIVFGLDEAAFYGASVVRVFAGDLQDGITFQDARGWIIEGLVSASLEAAKRGLVLGLENHGRLAGRSEQVIDLIETVRKESGVNSLGANPDFGNFLLVGENASAGTKAVGPYAVMAHVKDYELRAEAIEGETMTSADGNYYAGCISGEGEVNLSECFAALRHSGFDGWASIEWEAIGDARECIPRCLANCRSALR